MDMKTWLAIPGAVAVLAGGLCAANSYVAKDADLQKVAMRLEQKIRGDKEYQVQCEVWKMEDRYRGVLEHEWKPEDLDRYRKQKKLLQCLHDGHKECY